MNELNIVMPANLKTLQDRLANDCTVSQAIIPVTDDHLEGALIKKGGYVLVDFDRRPAPLTPQRKRKGDAPDCCLCHVIFSSGKSGLLLAEYENPESVRSHHSEDANTGKLAWIKRPNAIVGLIVASWDENGDIIWDSRKENPTAACRAMRDRIHTLIESLDEKDLRTIWFFVRRFDPNWEG